jgi:cytochrome c553
MTPNNGQGNQFDLVYGKELYQRYCADCHGEKGEGNAKKHMPLVQAQHYQYLVRQYRWIRIGLRRNADEEMVNQIQAFSPQEERAVLSYTASLRPADDKLAKPGWLNPDFPEFWRQWRPEFQRR